MINATDGGVQAWNGTTVVNGLAGFAAENASNLGTTGAGAPQGFTPVLGPGSVIGSYAANANQPLAVITPSLVPINDGGISFVCASPGIVFVGCGRNHGNRGGHYQPDGGNADGLDQGYQRLLVRGYSQVKPDSDHATRPAPAGRNRGRLAVVHSHRNCGAIAGVVLGDSTDARTLVREIISPHYLRVGLITFSWSSKTSPCARLSTPIS